MVHTSNSFLSHTASVHDATADVLISNATLNHNRVFESARHRIALLPYRTVFLDPSAPDFNDVVIHEGDTLAPDEILGMRRPSALKIPLKTRAEFEQDPQIDGSLPSSGLLRALHYYASTYNIREATLDETALLAFGSMVESWADELIEAHDSMFLAEKEGLDTAQYAPEDSDESDLEPGEQMAIVPPPEVLDLSLSESDTCSEVQTAKRRRVENASVSYKNGDETDGEDDGETDGGTDGGTDGESIDESDEESNDSGEESDEKSEIDDESDDENDVRDGASDVDSESEREDMKENEKESEKETKGSTKVPGNRKEQGADANNATVLEYSS